MSQEKMHIVCLTEKENKALQQMISEKQDSLNRSFTRMHDDYGNVKSLYQDDVEPTLAMSKFFADLKDKLTAKPVFEIN